MRRSSESPESGSAHKRRRLSSPTYDDHFPITQEDIERYDEAERQLSQAAPVTSSHPRSLPSDPSKVQESDALNIEVLDGEDPAEQDGEGPRNQEEWSSSPPNPSTTQERMAEDSFFGPGSSGGGGFVSAAMLPTKPLQTASNVSGFTSAASLALAPPLLSQIRKPGRFYDAAHVTHATLANDDVGSGPEIDPPPSQLAKFGGFGFASALPRGAENDHPSSPFEEAPRQEHDPWFDSDTSSFPPAAFTFQTARMIMDKPIPDDPPFSQQPKPETASELIPPERGDAFPHPPDEKGSQDTIPPAPADVGFTSAASVSFNTAASLHFGKKSWAAPSAEALARAAEKIKQWEAEDVTQDAPEAPTKANVENAPVAPVPTPAVVPAPAFIPAIAAPISFQSPALQPFKTPSRPALRPMENSRPSSMRPPETPTSAVAKKAVHYTDIGGGVRMKNTQFKSPLISRNARPPSAPTAAASPLVPQRQATPSIASSSKLPAAFPIVPVPTSAVPATPVRAGPSTLSSPAKGRSLGMTPVRSGGLRPMGNAKFSTPFKKGMAPGEPGRTQLESGIQKAVTQFQTPSVVAQTPKRKVQVRKEYKFFDLNPLPERKTLASSGLEPLLYTEEELEDMGINVDELRQMRPDNAIYYSFHSIAPTNNSDEVPESFQWGPEAACAQLKERGCTLATQEWVTNHYGLILWKLAGMVCLEPERERDPQTKRWCWSEVMRQLLYRYERELNGGTRPALRLICTEDAPAACPMVLCVSAITWAPATVDGNAIPFDPHPELEVTDGWYRLRAKVDLPLGRAVRRGLIKIGTKLATSGTRLSGDRKEACEILQAYDNTWLELSGNSTHLASWHAKLGFVKQPFIATLDSLTPDGGAIPAMDLIVTKAYPIAYLEFIRNDDGSMTKFGPRDEREEQKAQDQWLARRENEISKIRITLEKQIEQLEKLAERLHNIAGSRFESVNKSDGVPDHIESLYSDYVDEESGPSPELFNGLSYKDAGWLRIHTQDQIRLARERIGEDIERELRDTCPPRNVRDFRVIVVRDARWRKKEPTRTAQITLWDPLRMVFSEGRGPGDIREGQRFLVTNLEPSQPSAWMAPGPESVVYLVSKKNARWTDIKSRRS